jgi:predicted nucleic acid-binding protein
MGIDRLAASDPGYDGGRVRIYSQLSVDISEQEATKIRVFPNPSYDNIQIDLNKEAQKLSLNIFNVYGVLVLSKNFNHVSTIKQQLPIPKGLYFIELISNDGSKHVIKVIKR